MANEIQLSQEISETIALASANSLVQVSQEIVEVLATTYIQLSQEVTETIALATVTAKIQDSQLVTEVLGPIFPTGSSTLRVTQEVIEVIAQDAGPEPRQKIYLAYDGALGCIYVNNRAVGETIQIWPTTNRLSLLTDCWWAYLTDGLMPIEQAQRAFVFTEGQGQGNTANRTAGGGRCLYPQVTPSNRPNMAGLGLTALTPTIGTNALVTTPYAIATVAGRTQLTFPVSDITAVEPGFYKGAIVHVLTGIYAGNSYKVLDSDVDVPNSRVTMRLQGSTLPSLTTADIVSLAPVVTAILCPPLGSSESGDMLYRRTVDAVASWIRDTNAVAAGADRLYSSASTYGILKYGLSRLNLVGDETSLAATGSSEPDTFGPLNGGVPWLYDWAADGGVNTYLEPSTPAVNVSNTATRDAGLFSDLRGDGSLLFPSVKAIIGGSGITILGLYLFGKIDPNQMVDLGTSTNT